WQVLATVDGRPWIALRTVGGDAAGAGGAGRVTLLWLASAPSAETNWPKSASFVLFFAEVANRAWEAQAGEAIGGSAVEWERMKETTASPHTQPDAARAVDLRDLLGGVAIVLLVGAAGWFVVRGRG